MAAAVHIDSCRPRAGGGYHRRPLRHPPRHVLPHDPLHRLAHRGKVFIVRDGWSPSLRRGVMMVYGKLTHPLVVGMDAAVVLVPYVGVPCYLLCLGALGDECHEETPS